MAKPIRFPSGISLEPQKSILSDYPSAGGTNSQVALTEDFIPYLAADYTVTTAVAGTAVTFPFNGGAIKLATSANATDTVYLLRGGAAYAPMNGNKFWMDFKLAYPRAVLNANDTNIYLGWFDTVNPVTATNGIYFFKAAGGTSVAFVIKKAGVTTTFNNIADLALPSGLFGDAAAANALLNATIAGGAFTAVSVNTAGAGYQSAPLILSTATAAGTVGSVPVYAQIGSTAINQGNPQLPTLSSGLPYGSVVAPYVVVPGSGFTNAGPLTTLLEVEPVIDLQCYFDGKGKLVVGVNGRAVMSILGTATELGVVGVAAGATVNVATAASPSFYSTTQLTASVAPFQPPVGSPFNLFPLIPMNIEFGMANSTANIRTLYLMEYNVAIELN